MESLFRGPMTYREICGISSLGLAHVGDAVYEILVRTMLITDGRSTNTYLHRDTIALVCAQAQAEAAEILLPHLDEDEKAIYKRGKNAEVHNIPKNATHSQYSRATGLEALFGALYLMGKMERLRELFTLIMEARNAT